MKKKSEGSKAKAAPGHVAAPTVAKLLGQAHQAGFKRGVNAAKARMAPARPALPPQARPPMVGPRPQMPMPQRPMPPQMGQRPMAQGQAPINPIMARMGQQAGQDPRAALALIQALRARMGGR